MASDFESAVAAVGRLEKDPGNDVKLRLYALYKQATDGDVSGSRPGMLDFVARAKYDAWAQLAGTSIDDARLQYAELVDSLLAP